MVLPFPYGLGFAIILGPGFIIAGVIFLIKDKKHPESQVSTQIKFCTKCGHEMSNQNMFCTKCGAKSS